MISNDLLKNKILDLAIHGKLVDNDLSLASIDVEEVIEDIPFEIPSNWKWTRVGSISTYKNGYAFNSSMMEKDAKDGLYVIKSANIGKKEVIINSKTDIVSNINEKMKDCIIHKGDILMVLSSQSANVEPLGVSALYEFEYPALLNQRVLKIISDLTLIIPKYFLYVINTDWFHTKVSQKAAGLAQANLKLEHVLSMEVPVPPLEEQQRIVVKIEELFDLVDKKTKNDQEKDKLKTLLKDKILDSAIHGNLVENNLYLPSADVEELAEDIPFEIPNNWKWQKIKNVFNINPRNKLDDNLKVSFIEMSNLDGGYINSYRTENRAWKCLKSRFTHFKQGDVIIAKITPCFENRKSAYLYNLNNDYGAGTTELHVLRDMDNIFDMRYVLWFVKRKKFIDQGKGKFTGTAGQQRISKKWLEEIPIPIPPLEEQHKIVAKIEECFELIDKL